MWGFRNFLQEGQRVKFGIASFFAPRLILLRLLVCFFFGTAICQFYLEPPRKTSSAYLEPPRKTSLALDVVASFALDVVASFA